MSIDQLENPPGKANAAPAGEIRERPMSVLRRFTLVILGALVLPALVLIAVGIDMGQSKVLGAGIVLLIVLCVVFGVTLWKIISSRGKHIEEGGEVVGDRNS